MSIEKTTKKLGYKDNLVRWEIRASLYYTSTNNVEQYVNYHKAVAAKDDVTATRILGLKNVTEQRRMGKAIPNFAQWRGLQKEKIE